MCYTDARNDDDDNERYVNVNEKIKQCSRKKFIQNISNEVEREGRVRRVGDIHKMMDKEKEKKQDV